MAFPMLKKEITIDRVRQMKKQMRGCAGCVKPTVGELAAMLDMAEQRLAGEVGGTGQPPMEAKKIAAPAAGSPLGAALRVLARYRVQTPTSIPVASYALMPRKFHVVIAQFVKGAGTDARNLKDALDTVAREVGEG